MLEEITREIEQMGKNPDDFIITILENGYKIEPRASYEPRQIAKEEDTVVMLAVAELAETILGGGV